MIATNDQIQESTTRDVNVLGGKLGVCSIDPLTGFYRDGCCSSGPEDTGSHTVCSVMTDKFLEFSKAQGNDLTTPRPEWGFAGLKTGDRWCLCAMRWLEAYIAGYAPEVVLKSTHRRALKIIELEYLKEHALD
jgi:uncharacterized protein